MIVEHFRSARPENAPSTVTLQLAKLLGKASSNPIEAPNPRSQIASLMGHIHPIPWADLWLRNAGIKPLLDETCFIVEPVQMVASMNNIAMRPLPRALTEAQLQAWITLLEPVLTAEDAQIENINGQCLLRIQRPLKIHTLPLDEARHRDLRDCLPSGEDSGWIRRIMTECQMVLHDLSAHPELAATGLNGVWMWGNAHESAIKAHQQKPSVKLRTTDPWLAALLHLTDKQNSDALISIWHGNSLTFGLEETLTAKVAELWSGQLQNLSISLWQDSEPGHVWHLKRHHLLRFWSRPVKIDG